MSTSKTLFSGLLALAASTPLWIASTSTASTNAAASRLEGVWEVYGVPEAGSGIPPFTNLVTIEADGGLVNVDPEVGTGVGETHKSGPGTYTAGFFGFIDVGIEAIYEVQSTLTSSGPDAWAGPFRTQVSDLAGNLLFEYEGTVSGTRRIAQPY